MDSMMESPEVSPQGGGEPVPESQSYQHMVHEVEGLIQQVSASDCDLDVMVKKVERGYELIKQLKDRLATTKDKIEQLQLDYEQADPATDS